MLKNLLQEALAEHSKFRVLALDPGETTGACVFEGPRIIDGRQLQTGLMPYGAVAVRDYINQWHIPASDDPDVTPKVIDAVVMEDYRVYSWKAKDHAWQGLHTPRLIGAIELICYDLQLPSHKQSAQNAKGFVTDDKLQMWGLWLPGMRHCRDAIRHAIFHLLFKVAQIDKR